MKHVLPSAALLLILPLLILSLMGDFSALLDVNEKTRAAMNEIALEGLVTDPPSLSLSAKHALLMTQDGHIIYGKNEEMRAEPASCTKIMTALLACEYLDRHALDTKITVSPNAVGIEGSSIYLEKNETVSLLDLVYALMLASANDAAIAIAEAVSGSVEDFVALMNEKAAVFELSDTHFDNPHGLPSEEHYTTAHSLAKLMAKAMEHPLFARITNTRRYTMQSEGGARYLSNHNRLLSSYEHTVGGKTGFTKRAGRCLVSCAQYGNARLIAVTLSAPDDWNDHKTMYQYGFDNWEAVRIPAKRYELPVISGKAKTLAVVSDEIILTLPKKRGEITFSAEAPRFLYAPTAKDDVIGEITVYLSEKPIAILPLKAEAAVKEEKPKGFFEKLFS